MRKSDIRNYELPTKFYKNISWPTDSLNYPLEPILDMSTSLKFKFMDILDAK